MNIKNAETIRKLLRVFSFQQLIRDKGIRYGHLTQYLSLSQNIVFVNVFDVAFIDFIFIQLKVMLSPGCILHICHSHYTDGRSCPWRTGERKSAPLPTTHSWLQIMSLSSDNISENRIDYVWSNMGISITDAAKQWEPIFGLIHKQVKLS